MSLTYRVTYENGFEQHTEDIDLDRYREIVRKVYGIDKASRVYEELYREAASDLWPYEEDGETLREGFEEGTEPVLTPEQFDHYTFMDFQDSPNGWAFITEDHNLTDWEVVA